MNTRIQGQVEKLLAGTDVSINGNRPWDPQIHDPRFYSRVLSASSLGLGESYMDGWWDCAQLDEFIARILRQDIRSRLRPNLALIADVARARLLNRQNTRRAFRIGEAHYDIGNDLYQYMLDKRLTYTCGYWKDATTLDDAQEAKLDLVCRKIGLKHGERVLDIGCGWGSFAKFAAEKYGAHVVGITVSKEQIKLGRELCQGLPIELRLQDYREVNEPFDHIVSLGMIEHVGYKNYRQFMQITNRCLKPRALFLLHTIGSNYSTHHGDPWFDKYIFPNGMLPSIEQLGKASENLFVMEDWHNIGIHYDKTLTTWFASFNQNWPKLQDKYNDTFYRMWKYYLLSMAGSFRSRSIQVRQIVFSKGGELGGYQGYL